jgi:diguanylate cyclase (GGDEF)-like protein
MVECIHLSKEKGRTIMPLYLADVFDEYPNPVYVIKPIINKGITNDFEYVYVNKAFALLVGRDSEELTSHNFVDVFGSAGERQWLDAFASAAMEGKHFFVNHVSDIINKKLYTEIFHIEPDMCCCITHDMQAVSQNLQTHQDELLRLKANSDFLTGFYNRFYLNEMHGVFVNKLNVGITFLDINNLKRTNDTYGHSAGDELIVKVAGMIKSHYKDSIVFRIGSDEFLIVTEDCSRDKFMQISALAQAHFEEENIAAIGYKYYDKIEDLRKCVDECDELMYDEKCRMKGLN